ncbi:hypothetical protein HJFPF1_12725 [Paramyrothecium foliicola]|nr:hypothetical protein HJFPF1_12725 [Paramyrothecium foliicola]
MAQPAAADVNGVSEPDHGDNEALALSGKRKRDADDEDEEVNGDADIDVKPTQQANGLLPPTEEELVKSFVDVLQRYAPFLFFDGQSCHHRRRWLQRSNANRSSSLDISPPILKRALEDRASDDEPQAKRQKSTEPPSPSSVLDKFTAGAYTRLEQVADDIVSAVKSSLAELNSLPQDTAESRASTDAQIAQINAFKHKALELFRRERAYPQLASDKDDDQVSTEHGKALLSIVGHAPQERRLFSSLPLSDDNSWREGNLPLGVSISRVVASKLQERTQTLGELFVSPRTLPPLQPPKQPKTQAKSNVLDFYQPDLTDTSTVRGHTYFTTKLSAGHFLDYSNATPSSQTVTKKHERAQSLAGKKPSSSELEISEMETLFRGAFSSFAPCKDDSSAVVPSSVAGRMWWQRAGYRNFQNMIEVEYYGDSDYADPFKKSTQAAELDEAAVKEAIDSWDDTSVDPSLEDAMGAKREEQEKEAEEILDEVSDLIETLASYQRIRNLTLPNSQNRQSSDPVNGDMLANAGPQPSEEEIATYQVLKAQLALIIKTLPPFAVAKLNGDQLDDLLISTKVQVQSDQYMGVMEEDEAGMQARLRAQQQAAQANVRPPSQRTPSISNAPYNNYYQSGNQYSTPSRTPSHPQQYYRPGVTPNYQQPRTVPQPAASQPRPQPNQYTRPNGFTNQYATQLAKAQTPYGHQNMPQFASQQRPQYGQMPQQPATNARFQYQQSFPQQQPATPTPTNYGAYTNGAGMPPRNMSPQVPPRQTYSQSPNLQQPQRYGTPSQAAGGQMNRHPSVSTPHAQPSQSPGLTGYHTVIPEAQQQRIVDQAKARFAAQERSAMFGDKISQPMVSGLAGIGLGGTMDVNRLAAARASLANQPKPQTPTGQKPGINGTPGPAHVPLKVTPVPVPVIPGSQQQRKPST